MTITLRPATPADDEFCFQLHKAALGAYIAAVWGWEDTMQREFHARAFDPSRWQIITVDGADVGLLIVDYRPSEVYLSRIEIHPDHQGRGIGGHLLSQLLADARRRGQPLTLEVLTVNRRAHGFYTRYGLRDAGPHPPNKIRMRSS